MSARRMRAGSGCAAAMTRRRPAGVGGAAWLRSTGTSDGKKRKQDGKSRTMDSGSNGDIHSALSGVMSRLFPTSGFVAWLLETSVIQESRSTKRVSSLNWSVNHRCLCNASASVEIAIDT